MTPMNNNSSGRFRAVGLAWQTRVVWRTTPRGWSATPKGWSATPGDLIDITQILRHRLKQIKQGWGSGYAGSPVHFFFCWRMTSNYSLCSTERNWRAKLLFLFNQSATRDFQPEGQTALTNNPHHTTDKGARAKYTFLALHANNLHHTTDNGARAKCTFLALHANNQHHATDNGARSFGACTPTRNFLPTDNVARAFLRMASLDRRFLARKPIGFISSHVCVYRPRIRNYSCTRFGKNCFHNA